MAEDLKTHLKRRASLVLMPGNSPAIPVSLSAPGAAEHLSEVAGDWLFEMCSIDGKRKLLAEHDLLAA
jgi:hypothetical protein